MDHRPDQSLSGQPIVIPCRDGYDLGGHIWSPGASSGARRSVILNPATGVLARYYHHYARFLMQRGFTVITYDYRGIGDSRPPNLRDSGIRWRDWGELDFDAVAAFARRQNPHGLLTVVGHSIGGFLPGYSDAAGLVDRFLTVGAQYAYWPDYAPSERARMFWKWHLAMPLMTGLLGYFPGRKLGWLEDLPAGVVWEWVRRGSRFELSYPRKDREGMLRRFASVKAPILAVSMTDDEFATLGAVRRALNYYTGSPRRQVVLRPSELGFEKVGHFGLFHARHRDGFWRDTCRWLEEGVNPWPSAELREPFT